MTIESAQAACFPERILRRRNETSAAACRLSMNTNDRASPYDIQAPVPAHVIDKGLPTAGLLTHVMMTRFADHLPLYRQDGLLG
jgi:hypothetical protein